jgi:uncharacterized protein (TIGR00251 family)
VNGAARRWQGDVLILELRVQPRAGRDGFAGECDGRLKIRLAAAPVDGAANQRLIAFLASEFKVAKSSVAIVKGQTSRSRTVAIQSPAQWPEACPRPPASASY